MIISILEWLEHTATIYEDKVAFSDAECSVTFSYVLRKAKAIGSAICKFGIYRKPIAVISGRHCKTPIAFLGVAYSGCFYAPIDATLPVSRINQIIETLNPALILVDETNKKTLESISYTCGSAVLEELINHNISQDSLNRVRRFANENDPLYVIFTSGSTGKPKGVITSHHSVMCYIDAYSEVMKIESSDVLGNQSPLDYIAAIRDIYLPVKHGCSTVIIPKQLFMTPTSLFDYMNKHKVTSVGWSVSAFTVPVKLNAFNYSKPESLSKICFSGSVMPCSVLKIWQSNLPTAHFVNQYGPTEATASCTYYEVEKAVENDDILPIGLPYRDYRIYLINDENELCADGEQGEICVAGPILALSYYNNPEQTARDFIQNPVNKYYSELLYKTGDIGVRRPDGILEFHGRKDRQIKHMGHRVELDEVEGTANTVKGVNECCVIYSKPKETIFLFYTGEATMRDIAVEMRKTLPGFMIPRKIVQLDEMPKLPNSKIDIKYLKEIAES